MAIGQGANSALPIAAYFLKKLYADRSLGYSQDEDFDIPAGFDPCGQQETAGGEEDAGEEAVLDELGN